MGEGEGANHKTARKPGPLLSINFSQLPIRRKNRSKNLTPLALPILTILAPALIKNEIKFSSYVRKFIQSGAVAKSYMRKGFVMKCAMRKCANIFPYMRRPLVIYEF